MDEELFIEEVIDEQQPISVYIRLNSKNEIIEVNSDVFISDLSGWIKIDEGIGYKYSHAQGNYFEKPIVTENGDYTYEYVNGKVREKDQSANIARHAKEKEYSAELNALYSWFDEYDNQIKQYERDKRLNIQGGYHIAENEYSIDELDELAVEKAERITALRKLTNETNVD